MSDKSFSSELQKALSRPDVAQLSLDLEDYYRFNQGIAARKPDAGEYEHSGNFAEVMDPRDPDRALAYLVLAMAEYDDADFLGVMAAGLLENLLQRPTPDVLNRVANEARKTARLRWMLGIPFRHAIPDWVWEKINDFVIVDVDNTPLPPRPSA